jgi:hypothetical protein
LACSGLIPLLLPVKKKVSQTFMFKRFYHSLRNVTQKVTFVNIKFIASAKLEQRQFNNQIDKYKRTHFKTNNSQTARL